MPKFRLNIDVTQKGRIFDSAATQAAAARMVIAINDALAEEGVRRIRARLKNVLQNPTGFYESNIMVDRREIYRGITDQGVVYGGWLEGVTAANSATRFKGYKTFRLVQQSIEEDKYDLVEPAVADFVAEMNG